ncbi:hypothetical protein [Paraburkholderia terrae]|uniref:hypothetical protein n=1 Tax=Paraburkholderia terrae TaxID=311230 RepID=UPI001EE1B333|nr:hypothetical protein [Paraburkholderia terrae]GJH00264.1 hypothetical protein CBA19C8_06925 [Paraburkholderia terrae]
MRAEIALFKELMSPFWIGFDPLYQAVGHNDKNQPTLHVFDPPPMPLAPPGKDAMTATAMLKAMPLDVMASRCDLDAMRGDIHVFVRYADGTHQYAVRQEALRRYPRHVITERVAQYLAEYIMSDVPQRGRYG